MQTGEAGSSRPPPSYERREMDNVKIVAPRAEAWIENDSISMCMLDGESPEGLSVPMSRCELVNVVNEADPDSATLVLATRNIYLDDDPPYRNVRSVNFHCTKTMGEDGALICRCPKVDMLMAMSDVMKAVEIINRLYLTYHEASPGTIKEITATMSLIGKARKIIGKRHDETKVYVPVPKD